MMFSYKSWNSSSYHKPIDKQRALSQILFQYRNPSVVACEKCKEAVYVYQYKCFPPGSPNWIPGHVYSCVSD